jgi:hypothetical protein
MNTLKPDAREEVKESIQDSFDQSEFVRIDENEG